MKQVLSNDIGRQITNPGEGLQVEDPAISLNITRFWLELKSKKKKIPDPSFAQNQTEISQN